MRRSLLLAAGLVTATAAPARAWVVSEDPFAGESTEAGVVVRTFTFGLFGDILEPPLSPEDANPSGVGIADFRLYFVRKSASWKIVVHDQLTTRIASHAGFGAIPIGRSLAPPRLLPLHADIADDDTFGVTNTVDWIYAAYDRGRMTLTVGRQPITFGRGKIWKPTDVVATFALTEVDTEYKPGADAVRLDWSPSERTSLTAVAATGELERDHDVDADFAGTTGVVRGKHGWNTGELGVLAGLVRGDAVAGIDGVWDTGSFEVYAEATGTLITSRSLASPLHDEGDVVAEAIAGATFRPSSKLTLSPELLYNGFGAWDPADYLDVALMSERVAIGQQTTLGRLYTAGIASWEAHPLLQIGGAALVNARDPGALLSASLVHSLSDNVQGILGGYAPIGERPEGLAARSEHGLFPYFLFLELEAVI